MRHAIQDITPPIYERRGAGADDLVRSHMPLVRRIAWHIRPMLPQGIELEDIVQTGLVALVEAARSYEDRGHSFATYASIRIRGEMIDTLRKHATSRRGAIAERRKLMAVRDQLKQQLLREPRADEMASALNVDAASYATMLARAEPVQLSPIEEHTIDSSMFFADISDSADMVIDRDRIQALLTRMISRLAQREAMILQLYFSEEMNLEEIGQTLGIGAARVCQIKKAAIDKLRVMFSQELGDATDSTA